MKSRRRSAAWRLAKGVLAAAGITLAGMLLLAAAIIFTDIGDGLIRILNQILKAAAVIAGTYLAVGRGGQQGLITGAAIGAVYAVVGYAAYILMGGGAFILTDLLGELLICIAAGAAAGAVFANIKPARKKA